MITQGPHPKKEEEGTPCSAHEALTAWPVCARMDDANQKGARWRWPPAPGGGCAVNNLTTSCQDLTVLEVTGVSAPGCLTMLCPGPPTAEVRGCGWCADPAGSAQAPVNSLPHAQAFPSGRQALLSWADLASAPTHLPVLSKGGCLPASSFQPIPPAS